MIYIRMQDLYDEAHGNDVAFLWVHKEVNLWTVCHLHSSSSFLRQWLWPRSHKHWSTHRASVCHGHAWCLMTVLLGAHIIAVRKLYPSKMKILWMNSGRPKLGGWHEWKEWRITWMKAMHLFAVVCVLNIVTPHEYKPDSKHWGFSKLSISYKSTLETN